MFTMKSALWAEQIEEASAADRARMAFGPYSVSPEGNLSNLFEGIMRNPKPGLGLPTPWPIQAAPGWRTIPIDDEWSAQCWCALGGEWAFERTSQTTKRVVIVPEEFSDERKTYFAERLAQPLALLSSGEAFAFCGMLYIVPEQVFDMNSFVFHPQGRERLPVFVGYRGHCSSYPEVITPGVYRAHSHPTHDAEVYRKKARMARNVVKQFVFECENTYLTEVQAMGVLQHYGIIGPTDMLDLSYDVNIAKWFSLNVWDRSRRHYVPKKFNKQSVQDGAIDECSIVYTMIVRLLVTQLQPEIVSELTKRTGLRLMKWSNPSGKDEVLASESLSRNLAPLWSERPSRQSGFGLRGIGPREYDSWGSVLGIVEHRYHPTIWPDGWDRIGGAQLNLNGSRFSCDDDTSGLEEHILPQDSEVITRIRKGMTRVLEKAGFN
jgi:hypothetical protein